MRVRGPDHVVLVSPDPERLVRWYQERLGLVPERLEEWRRGEVPFVSLRVSPTFLVDVMAGHRTGTNVDHLALVVEISDLAAITPAGGFDVEMGPTDLFGAQGVGRGVYVRDPDGNRIELRSYRSDG